MHRPKFPPVSSEWVPTAPKYGPPLPRFMTNPKFLPWLTYQEEIGIAQNSGWWATRKAESLTSPQSGVQEVQKIAQKLYAQVLSKYA